MSDIYQPANQPVIQYSSQMNRQVTRPQDNTYMGQQAYTGTVKPLSPSDQSADPQSVRRQMEREALMEDTENVKCRL